MQTRLFTSLALALSCASCFAGGERLLYRSAAAPLEPTLHQPKTAAARTQTLPSPLSLTAPDGTGLTLSSLQVHGVVDGPVALTEYHMDFVNAEDRTIEGRFEITLPPGAEISRFSMRVGDTWQEAEVVERQRAQQVYEAILHQGLDPALLEQDAGNRFSARVFPIAPHETKQLIVSYVQTLGDEHDYVLPLRGLPKIPNIQVRVDGQGPQPLLDELFEDHLATEDLEVPIRADNKAYVHGELALARIVPVAAREQEPTVAERLDAITLLVDTSASRAVGWETKVERLAKFCAALHEQLPGELHIEVVAFDQTSERIYAGSLAKLDAKVFARLSARRALGATDLAGALARLGSGEGKRLILATDGVPTLEDGDGPSALADKRFARVDVLVDGSLRDQAVLDQFVAEGQVSVGQVIDLERERPSGAAARVRRPTLAPMQVEVAGASWISPRELVGLQPGDEVLVFAQFAKPTKQLQIELHEGELERGTFVLETQAMERPLLERSIVSRRVHEHMRELAMSERPERAAKLRREIVELSTEFRVLTPLTAMLVLENQAAYDRFGLERDTLAPILRIEDGAVSRRQGRDELMPLSAIEPALEGGSDSAPRGAEPDEIVVEATPVAANSSAGMTIGMEEAKQLPVGSSTSRDFTAVVDLAPTAARDAAGISLAGTTGAESRYTVDGANIYMSGRAPSPRYAEVVPRGGGVSVNYEGGVAMDAAHLLDAAVRRCYEAALIYEGDWGGRATLRLELGGSGRLESLWMQGAEGHREFEECVTVRMTRAALGPSTDGLPASLERRYVFRPGLTHDYDLELYEAATESQPRQDGDASTAVTGRYAEVVALLAEDRKQEALELAEIWHELFPGDPLALVGLGHALAAVGEYEDAARAYAGLVDLHPSRPEILRYAGNLLESMAKPDAELAIACYEQAIAARPDQPSTYRMLAFAQARIGDYDAALATLEHAMSSDMPTGRYAGVRGLLQQDIELLGGVWAASDPALRKQALRRVIAAGGKLDSGPSIRFVLSWETDANDVDLHVRDRVGHHAYYQDPTLPSGGLLLADVTTGYGPEGFVIPDPHAFPYELSVHYFNQGVSGHGMGQVQIVRHDGQGKLSIENRPFVLMAAQAEIDLGLVGARAQAERR